MGASGQWFLSALATLSPQMGSPISSGAGLGLQDGLWGAASSVKWLKKF